MNVFWSTLFVALNLPAIILATELAEFRQPLQTAVIKIANYLDTYNDHCNVDCTFTVLYAHAILEDMEDSDDPFSKLFHKYYVERIMKKSLDRLRENDTNLDSVLEPNLMRKPIEFDKVLRDNSTNFVYEPFGSCTLDWPLCLDMIFLISNHKMDKLNDSCIDFLKENYTGYALTHQLLYVQLLKLKNITDLGEIDIPEKVEEYCSKMYQEGRQLLNRTDSLRPNYDLLFEIMLFCGYEGYVDFFQPKWLEYTLNQQTEIGCFTIKNMAIPRKRNLNVYDDGCADHTTGLAFATFCLFLNYISKM